MSALTARSALLLQLAQLDATQCAGCGHSLKKHPTTARDDGNPCQYWEWKYKDGMAQKQIHCRCKNWRDPSEQLPIGAESEKREREL